MAEEIGDLLSPLRTDLLAPDSREAADINEAIEQCCNRFILAGAIFHRYAGNAEQMRNIFVGLIPYVFVEREGI
jgi:hypothetical protein